MSTPELSIGSSALLRVSGCPIQFWLAAANPELFSLVRQLDQKQEALQWYEKATDSMSAQWPIFQAGLGRLRDQAAELLEIEIGDKGDDE